MKTMQTLVCKTLDITIVTYIARTTFEYSLEKLAKWVSKPYPIEG